MNGNNKNYSIRPLTDEEQIFAADDRNYNYLFYYMRKWNLDQEEWYDILIIPYLDAVKKYHEYESARQYAFSTVLKNKLWSGVMAELKKRKAKKRMPEGGIVSLDYMMEGDNAFSEHTFDKYWIDKKTNVEKQVIFKELFNEFYKQCITYENEDGLYEDGEVCKYLKCEMDFLLKGYTRKQVNRKTEKIFPYGYDVESLEKDIEGFRRIFRQVFCI